MKSTSDSNSSRLYPQTPPAPVLARRSATRSRVTSAAVALAVVLGTGVGTVGVAQAASTTSVHSSTTAGWPAKHGTPPAAAGTVESVGTNTFTLKGRNGTTVTVDVGLSTTYRDGKVTSPTFTNVVKGEMVSVEGTTASGIVTATSVSIGFGGGFGGGMFGHGTPPAAAGTVESVGTNTFTLKGRNGTTVTVDVGLSTTYRDGKVTSPTFTNVVKGEMVSVEGTTASGIVTATSVSIGFGGGFGGGMFGHGTPPAAAGTVESVGTNTFTLKGRNGTTVTVDVGLSTTYRDGKVTSPTFTNVVKGEMVSVEGTTASGIVTATSVSIGFGGGRTGR